MTLLTGQLFSQTNKINKNGQRSGYWVTYSDKEKTKLSYKGKYRNGVAVGKCYYYDNNGHLFKKERNRFGKSKTILYHDNGKVRTRGTARIDNLPDRIHYYYYGKWSCYDTLGKLEKYIYYEKGKPIRSVYVNKSDLTNDSLMYALNLLEKTFFERNKDATDSITMFPHYHQFCERLRNRLYHNDSTVFIDLEKILQTYGYPSKPVVQESSDIPFYLLNYAPLSIREKHLDVLKKAADAGTLEWSSLAFYIDKIRIARGEKQLYGTQFYISKTGENVYYPSIDPDGLLARRRSVGLKD